MCGAGTLRDCLEPSHVRLEERGAYGEKRA